MVSNQVIQVSINDGKQTNQFSMKPVTDQNDW